MYANLSFNSHASNLLFFVVPVNSENSKHQTVINRIKRSGCESNLSVLKENGQGKHVVNILLAYQYFYAQIKKQDFLKCLIHSVHTMLCCVLQPCNKKHPHFQANKRQCRKDNIDDSLTKFRWLVAAPRDGDSFNLGLVEMNGKTVYTDTRQITLDSIYFTAGKS